MDETGPHERRTLWSQLANDGYKAHRRMWIHLLRVLYLSHFHPTANSLLSSWMQSLKRSTERGASGRRAESQAERVGLEERFRELLPKCELIHQAVQAVITRDQKSSTHVRLGRSNDETVFRYWEAAPMMAEVPVCLDLVLAKPKPKLTELPPGFRN